MLYNERVELILQQVQLQAIVKINDLKNLLNVSVDTVRRDGTKWSNKMYT